METTKHINIHIMGVAEEEERERKREKNFGEIMPKMSGVENNHSK